MEYVKVTFDCETQEIVTEPMSKIEIEALKLSEERSQAYIAEVQAKEAARAQILAKLGLTAEEAAVLLG